MKQNYRSLIEFKLYLFCDERAPISLFYEMDLTQGYLALGDQSFCTKVHLIRSFNM